MANKLKKLVVQTCATGDYIFHGEAAKKAESAIDYALQADARWTIPVDWEGGSVTFVTKHIVSVRREYEEVSE